MRRCRLGGFSPASSGVSGDKQAGTPARSTHPSSTDAVHTGVVDTQANKNIKPTVPQPPRPPLDVAVPGLPGSGASCYGNKCLIFPRKPSEDAVAQRVVALRENRGPWENCGTFPLASPAFAGVSCSTRPPGARPWPSCQGAFRTFVH